MTPNQQHRLVSITGTSILAARSDPAQCPAWPVLWLQSQAPAQAGSEGLGREADCRRARSSGIPRGTLRLPASPLGGGHPHAIPTFPRPYVSLRALEGGFMSSCLRNALKMRSPEHFPTALNLTFPELSLGCQDFVAIFINSHHWLLPFLPWPPSYSRLGKGLGLPYRPSSLPQTHPSHPLCAPRVPHLLGAQPLIYPRDSQVLQYGTQCPPSAGSGSPAQAHPFLVSNPGLRSPRLGLISRPGKKLGHRKRTPSLLAGLPSM